MSAVSVPGRVDAHGYLHRRGDGCSALADVVDLAAERRRRATTQRDADNGIDLIVGHLADVKSAADLAGLEDAVRRHPAGRARSRAVLAQMVAQSHQSRPATGSVYAVATPRSLDRARMISEPMPALTMGPSRVGSLGRKSLWLKAVGWAMAAILTVSGALGLGLMLRPADYQGATWQHTVTAGESVWGLAVGIGSTRSLEQVVEDIRSLNQLEDATLHEGQVLMLPID